MRKKAFYIWLRVMGYIPFGFDLVFMKPETTPNKPPFLSQLLCILMAKMPRKIVLHPHSC